MQAVLSEAFAFISLIEKKSLLYEHFKENLYFHDDYMFFAHPTQLYVVVRLWKKAKETQ